MIKRFVYTALIAAILVACSSSRKAQQSAASASVEHIVENKYVTDTALYYSRGACFGMCPIFEFTVMRDGKAVYIGKNHVDRIGRFEAQVSYSDVEQVVSKATQIGYFEMQEVYDNDKVQDLPNINTGINSNGKLYRVRNRYKGPASLQQLYKELDSLMARQAWKPVGKLPQD